MVPIYPGVILKRYSSVVLPSGRNNLQRKCNLMIYSLIHFSTSLGDVFTSTVVSERLQDRVRRELAKRFR